MPSVNHVEMDDLYDPFAALARIQASRAPQLSNPLRKTVHARAAGYAGSAGRQRLQQMRRLHPAFRHGCKRYTAGGEEVAVRVAQSSHIQSHSYDPETNMLVIQFVNGAVYQFNGVPATEYFNFAQASSPGSYFHSKIKGQYSTQLIGAVGPKRKRGL